MSFSYIDDNLPSMELFKVAFPSLQWSENLFAIDYVIDKKNEKTVTGWIEAFNVW